MHLHGPGYLVQGNPQATNVMVVITGARTAILVSEHPPTTLHPAVTVLRLLFCSVRNVSFRCVVQLNKSPISSEKYILLL